MEHEETESGDQIGVVADVSARQQLAALITSCRQMLTAEWQFYESRFQYSQKIVKQSGLLGIIALFFLFGAIIALILGILLTVSAVIGPGLATLSVTAGFIIAAVIFAWLARRNVRKLGFPELSEGSADGKG